MYEIKILSRNTTDAGFIYITDWEHYDMTIAWNKHFNIN